jgi:hypothetical protein
VVKDAKVLVSDEVQRLATESRHTVLKPAAQRSTRTTQSFLDERRSEISRSNLKKITPQGDFFIENPDSIA